MARSYKGKKGTVMQLYGFDEFYERIKELEVKGIDRIAENAFQEDCKIVKKAMDEKASVLPASLKNKMTEQKEIDGNHYSYGYGWDEKKHPKEKMIAAYLNYGTPRRNTDEGGQRIKINGKWVTLSRDRGWISPRYFITNAKRSAAQKLKKNHKKLIHDVMNELKKGIE